MTSFTDTLTIGIVFMLLFCSIAFYLYTCIQQMEQKISLQESILLDMKMSAEIKSYSELPAEPEAEQEPRGVREPAVEEYKPFEDSTDTAIEVDELSTTEEVYQSALSEGVAAAEYDSMSLKELQAAAKGQGLSTSGKNKAQLLEALKAKGPQGFAADATNSFLETSSSL